MARMLLGHDPITGISTWFDYEESTDRMILSDEQDVTPILEQARAMRNDGDYSRRGIKEDMWHYARIPLSILQEIKDKYGVDMRGANPDWPSFFAIINRDYPAFKATDGKATA